MATTLVAFGDPKAAKKWSAALAVDQRKKSYFENRFIGSDDNSIIQRKTELESDAGDTISFDLCVQMRNKPTYGDARLEGKEESLKFYTDQVSIDQVRHAASAGGKMSRKRTAHDMRTIAKNRLGDYFSRLVDELFFIYLSGARGINQDFIEDTSYTGFAGNSLSAPDASHILYGGSATSKASLAAADKMTKAVVERALNLAEMMQARNPDAANMVPVDIGEGAGEAYVCIMSPDQAFDMRNADTTGWLDIQKAAVTNEGRNNPIFKGGLGMIGGAILHKHRNVIRFSDYGSGSNVNAARALLLARQAGVVAYGTSGGLRYSWEENTKDYGNEPTVASGFIGGIKKTTFNGRDFGVVALDTAAKDPNS
jgi:N4-gp56 family major capsid protein